MWANFYAFSSLLGALSSLLISLLVYSSPEKTPTSKFFVYSTLCGALWGFGFYALTQSDTLEQARFWRWFMESASICMPVFWVQFVYHFLHKTLSATHKRIFIFLLVFLLFVNTYDLFHPGIFEQKFEPLIGLPYYPVAGVGYYLLFIFFLSLILYSLYLLYHYLWQCHGEQRPIIRHIAIAATIVYMGGGMTFLPTLGFNIVPVGIAFFPVYPIIVAYTILKHHLFHIKLIAIELLIGIILGVTILNLFNAQNDFSFILNITTLSVAIFFGGWLIHTIVTNTAQRERLNSLIDQLRVANERLKLLDKQKSEFISIASHQLRTPLTAIKGYASLLLEGSFGELPDAVKPPIQKIFQASQKLVLLVQNYLMISKLEQGEVKYRFENVDMLELLEHVLEEVRPSVSAIGLRVRLDVDRRRKYIIRTDGPKIRQAIMNILLFAAGNTEKGLIELKLLKDENGGVSIMISDTGKGLTESETRSLFEKLFPVEESKKFSYQPTYEMYITKELVVACGGSVWVHSDGPGQGETFFIQLPIDAEQL